VKRRYWWNPKLMLFEEITEDWTPKPRVELSTGTCYEGLQATDGTPINSRAKHREYMRLHGFTTTDDYTQSWERAAKERADFYTTGGDHKARKEAIGRAFYDFEKGKRR
jgi:hypothetical protein